MRIRTIKPEFFTHDGIFEAEQETGLPLRLAYIGLWCAADREGRFRWEPRRLKVQVMPYDDVDFSRVLDALVTRGFLVHYASAGREFGAIPSFTKHQVINNRERDSELPEPLSINTIDACLTREPRVDHASKEEGKGREGKGIGREQGDVASVTTVARVPEKIKRPTVGPEPEACAVILPGKPSAELLEAWREWQHYRQKRASAPFAKDRKPWTEQAARLSAKQIMQYAASHGDRIVCDRITKAIAAGWQGPNFDGLDGLTAYPRKMTYEQELEFHKPDPNSENGW
jgi:hypothetical protein